MDQIITVKVSISLLGTPKGVREEGGVLNNPTTEVEVNCLPLDIPNNIEVDISELSLGDALYISDIQHFWRHNVHFEAKMSKSDKMAIFA